MSPHDNTFKCWEVFLSIALSNFTCTWLSDDFTRDFLMWPSTSNTSSIEQTEETELVNSNDHMRSRVNKIT